MKTITMPGRAIQLALALALFLALVGLPSQGRSEPQQPQQQKQQPQTQTQQQPPVINIEAAMPDTGSLQKASTASQQVTFSLAFSNLTGASYILADYKIVILPAGQHIISAADLFEPGVPDSIGRDKVLRPYLVFTEKPEQITSEDKLESLTRLRRPANPPQDLAGNARATLDVRLSPDLLNTTLYEPVTIYLLCDGKIAGKFSAPQQ